jgi:hypothetical protein
MPIIPISTGFEEEFTLPQSERRAIFCREQMTDSEFSEVVSIAPGEVGVFTVYYMPPCEEIYTLWLSRGGYGTKPGQGAIARPAVDLYQLRMTLGGPENWVFTEARPQKIIVMPGSYRFELSNKEMRDSDMFMEYYPLPMAKLWRLSQMVVS